MENEKGHSESLNNLENEKAHSEPTDAAEETSAPQTEPQAQSITPSTDGGIQSSQEPPAKEKAPAAPPPNPVELLLLELSGPFIMQSTDDAPSTVSESDMPACDALPSSVNTSTANMQVQPNGSSMPEGSVSSTAPLEQMLMLPSSVQGQPSGGKMPGSSVLPSSPLGQITTSPKSFGETTTLSTAIVPVSSFHGGSPLAKSDISVESGLKVPAVQQLNNSQQQQPLASSALDGGNSSVQQTTTHVEPINNQVSVGVNLKFF